MGFLLHSASFGQPRSHAGWKNSLGMLDMEAYAVVETGGKQYRVIEGSVIVVERLPAEAGAAIELDRVLALSDGTALKVGAPVLAGARIAATVVEHNRGPKVISFKQKRRKGYKRKIGHRQEHTVLKIGALSPA
jgi:large subunit ribosomal protein L21